MKRAIAILLAALAAGCDRTPTLVAAGKLVGKKATASSTPITTWVNGIPITQHLDSMAMYFGIETTDTLTFTNRWTNWVKVGQSQFNSCDVGQIVYVYE